MKESSLENRWLWYISTMQYDMRDGWLTGGVWCFGSQSNCAVVCMTYFSQVQAALRRHDGQLVFGENYFRSSTDWNLQLGCAESRQSIYVYFAHFSHLFPHIVSMYNDNLCDQNFSSSLYLSDIECIDFFILFAC